MVHSVFKKYWPNFVKCFQLKKDVWFQISINSEKMETIAKLLQIIDRIIHLFRDLTEDRKCVVTHVSHSTWRTKAKWPRYTFFTFSPFISNLDYKLSFQLPEVVNCCINSKLLHKYVKLWKIVWIRKYVPLGVSLDPRKYLQCLISKIWFEKWSWMKEM